MAVPAKGEAAAAADVAGLAPPRFALIDDPLEYILADHLRQRSLCAVLKRFAEAGFAARGEADAVIGFLERDLPLHLEDEDTDLFPLLRKRAMPEDDLGVALARLSDDHRRGERMAGDIVAALAARPGERRQRLDSQACDLMRAYAASEHRHLAIENAVLLTLARIRLTRGDLKAMARSMKARRGA
jgi:hemerythrin-like domain-containing protein